MKKSNILIIGAEKNLGLYLSNKFSENNNVYSLSRTAKNRNEIIGINCDVTNKESIKKAFDNESIKNIKFDLVLYCPAMWGEDEKNLGKYLNSFMEVGPYGFIKIVDKIINSGKNKKDCLFVSIGSTATLNVGYSEYPSYGISKKVQRDLIKQYQGIYKKTELKFSNITLGSMSEEDGYVKYQDVFLSLNFMRKLSKGSIVEDVILTSKKDL